MYSIMVLLGCFKLCEVLLVIDESLLFSAVRGRVATKTTTRKSFRLLFGLSPSVLMLG